MCFYPEGHGDCAKKGHFKKVKKTNEGWDSLSMNVSEARLLPEKFRRLKRRTLELRDSNE